MDRIEELIREYLMENSDLSRSNKTSDCLQEEILLEYLAGSLDKERYQAVEHHLANCGFCLSQVSIAFEGQSKDKSGELPGVPQRLLSKTKTLLGVSKDREDKKNGKSRRLRRNLFLMGAIFFFVLSFVIPKYFIQFLVATLILGIRWAFESEGGRTLIMVIDSWRRHSRDEDEEISRRLKTRL